MPDVGRGPLPRGGQLTGPGYGTRPTRTGRQDERGKAAAGPDRDPLAGAIEAAFKEGRGDGLSVAKVADVIAQVIRDKARRQAEGDAVSADHVAVQSIVGMQAGKPLVQCRVGFERPSRGRS